MEAKPAVPEDNNVITIEDGPAEPAKLEVRDNFQNRRGGGRNGPGGRFNRDRDSNRGDRGDDRNVKNERNDFGNRRGGRGRGHGGHGGQNRNNDDMNRGHGQDHRMGNRGPVDKLQEKLSALAGPTYDLPPIDVGEKKFNGRNRLYIGNIGNDVVEDDLTELFKPFGETAEIFLNKEKNFAFIKVDYHSNAEKAKRELDGTVMKGRNLKIRFAPNSATVRVKNLSPMVSNELLYYAFSPFGDIEKATVCVDERGKPTGEGIIDFVRKGAAMAAVRKCSESCFFLTSSLQPAFVEMYEIVDDNDGYSDKNINKKNMEFGKERELAPRFAPPGSFEHEYGMRWKAIFELHQQKEIALKKELQLEKDKLEAQMEYARYEHETEMLRDQLRAREMDKERQKREWENKERQAEEERQRSEEQMRRTQEEMEQRMLAQQDDMRRRQQENNLFMQAHTLDNLLEQTEQAYDTPAYSTHIQGSDMDNKFMSSYERHNRFDGGRDNNARGGQNLGGGGGGGGGSGGSGGNAGGARGHWVSDNRRDDFPNKRRRF